MSCSGGCSSCMPCCQFPFPFPSCCSSSGGENSQSQFQSCGGSSSSGCPRVSCVPTCSDCCGIPSPCLRTSNPNCIRPIRTCCCPPPPLIPTPCTCPPKCPNPCCPNPCCCFPPRCPGSDDFSPMCKSCICSCCSSF